MKSPQAGEVKERDSKWTFIQSPGVSLRKMEAYMSVVPQERLWLLLPPFASVLAGNTSDFVCSHNLRLILPLFLKNLTLLGACTWFSPTLHLQTPLLNGAFVS